VAGHDGIAEVRLAGTGVSLYGKIANLSISAATLQLITAPCDPLLTPPGFEAELLYLQDRVVFASVVRIEALDGNKLALSLVNVPRPVKRRVNSRVRCDFAVHYRAVRADGHMGAWMECRAEDVSTGGIGLVFPPAIEIPRRVELRFVLPQISQSPADVVRRGNADVINTPETGLIKAVGRVTHCRPSTYGRVRCGTAFCAIASEERERLARFTGSLTLLAG
jgi:c-di-GMP-binding flagellar brake protein YcgR